MKTLGLEGNSSVRDDPDMTKNLTCNLSAPECCSRLNSSDVLIVVTCSDGALVYAYLGHKSIHRRAPFI